MILSAVFLVFDHQVPDRRSVIEPFKRIDRLKIIRKVC